MKDDGETTERGLEASERQAKVALIAIVSALVIGLLVMGFADQRAARERAAAPLITVHQACGRLLAEIDSLPGEGARRDAAAVRRMCAQIEAAEDADADAVGAAITVGGA